MPGACTCRLWIWWRASTLDLCRECPDIIIFRHWASFVIISTQRFELRRHMWCIRSIWLLRCACILRAWCCSILYVALHGDVARRVFRIPVLYISPSPLKLLLQNAMPQGRYRMVFGYYHFDLGRARCFISVLGLCYSPVPTILHGV